ncbi:MAG TPA: DMT family transporter [Candidatus Saccharimonadales bacterium]|nr:DMT family transporter [Candidatus Saccharimonadales bacterium]
MSWLYFALAAPFLYAIVNLIDDNLLRFVYKSPWLAATIGGLFGALPLLSRIFIHTSSVPALYIFMAILSGFLLTVFYLFYFRALSSSYPSVVVAFLNLVPATLIFLSYFLLHENLYFIQILGFTIVLLASILLTLSFPDLKNFWSAEVILPTLVAVVLIDAISLLMKDSYNHAQFYPLYMYYSAGLGLGGIVFLVFHFITGKQSEIRKLGSSFKKVVPIFLIAEVLNLVSELCINLATSKGPVSLVRVIEGIQPLFVLLIALILYPFAPRFFREAGGGGNFRKFVLMVVAVWGIVLVAANQR